MFGKPGRPPEDRVARRREVWAAIAPLIEQDGVRELTMRRAAQAARMSIGGLYHYFPTKRDLVLHGMDRGALERACSEFLERYGHLRESDPDAALKAFIRFFAGEAAFIRPAIKAALALGADDVLPRLGAVVAIGMPGFTGTLRLALPSTPEHQLLALATAARRLFFASLVDWTLTPETFEEELGRLVEDVRARQPRQASAPDGQRPARRNAAPMPGTAPSATGRDDQLPAGPSRHPGVEP